jgi:predicted nucleic acid-binding protein
MKSLIFDATPLIYLGKINLIEKIKYFPEYKYTIQSVCREVVHAGKNSGKQEAFVIEKLIKNKVIKVKTPANRQYISTLRENPKIHEADADVLALAVELKGMALLDDEKARGIAEIEGIEHHGTIYLLLRMMKMKLITKKEVAAHLNEMIHMGWRCSTELYAEIITALKDA